LELFLVDFSEARDLFVNIFGFRGLTEKSGTRVDFRQTKGPQHITQGEDSFEIVVTIPTGEDTQEAQHMPQNDDHDQQGEENNEEEEEEGNKAEGEEDEDYTPWCNANKKIKTFGDEFMIPTGRLRDLLKRINSTTPLEFRINRILRPSQE
jgi:hypothetical protein